MEPISPALAGRFFFNNLKNLYIFGCAGSLLLGGFFSSCSEWGLFSSSGARVSPISGFSRGAWALEHAGFGSCGSLALEPGLSS